MKGWKLRVIDLVAALCFGSGAGYAALLCDAPLLGAVMIAALVGCAVGTFLTCTQAGRGEP